MRSASPAEKALAEIARCTGSQLDPQLARIFSTMDFTIYDDILAKHKNHQDYFVA